MRVWYVNVTSAADALNENPALVCEKTLAPAVAWTETKKLALGPPVGLGTSSLGAAAVASLNE